MFLENKYSRWYNSIVLRYKNSPPLKGEKHHIIPRFMGGDDSPDNLVLLPFRAHYVCHLLLTKMVQTPALLRSAWYAWHRMTFSVNGEGVNSRKFEQFRESFIKALTDSHPSKKDPETWAEKCRAQALKAWSGNEERRRATSTHKKMMWADPEYARKQAEKLRARSKIAAEKSAEKCRKQLEYNGVVYDGWAALKQQTGITRELYNKYYINGIDPTDRIGKNGPPKKQ